MTQDKNPIAGTHYVVANPSGPERRITYRLLAYWEALRGQRPMPEENDVDPDAIADIWDHCFVMQVRDILRKDYIYTYLGPSIAEAFRSGLSVDDAGGMVSPDASRLAPHYQQVLDHARPLVENGEFVNLRGQTVKFRQCLLPLGREGRVEAVFGGMRFKIFV